MIRNLKVFLLAATAMLALSGVVASASQAEPLFHSEANETTLTLKTDGALNSKTAHQVFDAAGATVTCAGIEGHGLIKEKTTTTVTVDVKYDTPCTFVGQAATVEMKGCDYTITSHGTVSLMDATGKSCTNEPIVVSVPSPPCVVTIGTVGNENLHELTFHPVPGGVGTTREITVESHVTGITYTATGSGCPIAGTGHDGNYTTGNAIVTGEVPETGIMVGVWWE